MRRVSIALAFQTPLIFLLLIFSPYSAFGYRPFASTDAAVADAKEMEIEIGYFNLERDRGRSTFVIPKAVINYGLIQNLEVVGEFAVEEPRRGSARLVDAALSLKAVLKQGVLQEQDGVSFAVEAGPLLPSTDKVEKRVGFEGIGILSGKLEPLTYHLNFGGGIDRARNNAFVIWGAIVELPMTERLRLAAEVNGESVEGSRGASSGLVGLIWKTPLNNLFLDAGIRKAITGAVAPWTFTTGLTFGFSLPSSGAR